jgi:hypothetical protein
MGNMVPRITLPTGIEVELPLDLWNTASYVAAIDRPDGLTLVPMFVAEEDPEHPRVYGVFALTESASRILMRDVADFLEKNPAWMKQKKTDEEN